MKLYLASAALFAAVSANSNADDTTGLFGTTEQWKTGIIPIKQEENGE